MYRSMKTVVLTFLSLSLLLSLFQPIISLRFGYYLPHSIQRHPHHYSQPSIPTASVTVTTTLPASTASSLSSPFTSEPYGLTIYRSKRKTQPILSRVLAWVVHKVVVSKTEFVSGLKIKVQSYSSMDIIRGKINLVDMTFDKICFGSLYVSGGGKISVSGLDVRMRRLFFKENTQQTFRKSYEIFGDLLLTQADIVNSKIIRNLIQLLVNTVVSHVFAGPSQQKYASIGGAAVPVTIRRVSIINRRIVASGEAILGNNVFSALTFEVSTSAGVRENGHVIYLKDIQVVINPDNAMLRTSLPILLAAPVDVDIGEDCNIISLVIGEKHVWLRARSTISPISPFAVTPFRKKALYRYDVAVLLSSLFRISGGLLVKWLHRHIESYKLKSPRLNLNGIARALPRFIRDRVSESDKRTEDISARNSSIPGAVAV